MRGLVAIPHRQRRQAHMRRTVVVVDDYGNAVGYRRRCSACTRWKPLTAEHFVALHPGDGMGFQRRCRTCEKTLFALRYTGDSERAKRRHRGRAKRRLERAAADPSVREQERQRERRARQRRLERDPERERALGRERTRRHLERINSDPKRRQEYLENARIYNGLRTLAKGGKRHRPRVQLPHEVGGSLPAAPLGAFLDDYIERHQKAAKEAGLKPETKAALCEALGAEERSARGWINGERAEVHFALADRVFTAAGVLWWEVYDADLYPEAHAQAARLFEGDEDAQAA